MFELNGSYSDVQKTKTKTANRSPFWLPKIGTLVETIEERCVAGLNFENGRKVIFNIALILAATYVLPAPPNIGQAKDGQKGAAATFSPKRRFFPYVQTDTISPFITHHNIFLRSVVLGGRVENIHFSRNSIATSKNIVAACCSLNFDATDLPNS